MLDKTPPRLSASGDNPSLYYWAIAPNVLGLRTGPITFVSNACILGVVTSAFQLTRHVAGWVEGRLQRPEPEAHLLAGERLLRLGYAPQELPRLAVSNWVLCLGQP